MFARKKNEMPDVAARLSSMGADLESLQENMRGLLGDIGGAAGRTARRSARDVTNYVEELGNDGIEEMRKSVRARPLSVCALSLGTGALLGALLFRF